MPAALKHAWFDLTIGMATLLAYGIMVPLVGPRRAISAMALIALSAASGIFYRKKGAEVVMDERDRLIHLRSLTMLYAVLWLYFVAASMGLWVVYLGRGLVPVDRLPQMLFAGWLLVFLTRAIATVVQYRQQV